MSLRIKEFAGLNRDRLIIYTAAAITLLLFIYFSLVNFDQAISDLIDAVFGCGILASAFWGWRLVKKKNWTMEPGMIVSCAVVILPLLGSQRKYRLVESVFYTIAILAPILCRAGLVSFFSHVRFKESRVHVFIASLSLIFGRTAPIILPLVAIWEAPIMAALWIVEFAAMRNKDYRRRPLIYGCWIAALWTSGLLCYTGISFPWAPAIRRFLFPMGLFLWPVLFCMFVQLIRVYLKGKTHRPALKTALFSMLILAGLWILNLIFTEYLTEKYRMTHLLYFLLLSTLIIWKESNAKSAPSLDKLGIWFGLMLLNVGSIGYYLYQKIVLLEKSAAASPDEIPDIFYWLGYRFTAIGSFFSRNYAALDQNYPLDFYWYAQPILQEGRLGSTAYRLGFFPIIAVLLLSAVFVLLLRDWRCENEWVSYCVQYAVWGYIFRVLLSVLSDMALLVYDRVPFPFSGSGVAELFFLIMIVNGTRTTSAPQNVQRCAP